MGNETGMKPMPVTWKPLPHEGERIEKYYNVWRSFYYIPPTLTAYSNADYVWQSKFIFNIKVNQDQFRYGEDGRYSQSPLVLYDNSTQASFTDIVQAAMPTIHHLRHKLQNYIVNDLDAVVLADDFIGGLLGAIDESNKINPGNPTEATGGNGRDAMKQQWEMIKQGGSGFLQMTDRKTGQLLLDPAKLVIPIKNNYLEKAEKCVDMIALLYNDLEKSLSTSAPTAGEEIKPRTPVAALEQSIKAANRGTFFMSKGYEIIYKTYGERMIQYILQIAREANEGYTKRFDEFEENVGYANGLAIEGISQIPPEAVGLTVEYVDLLAKKEFLAQLATEYVKNNELDITFLYLILAIDNFKQGFLLMRIGIKQMEKKQQEIAALQQQYQMQQLQMQLQIAQATIQAKSQGNIAQVQAQGQVDSQLQNQTNTEKSKSQQELTNLRTQNKIAENQAKQNQITAAELQQPLQQAG